MIKNNIEFVEILKKIATEYKTLYVNGCFGAPLTNKNKDRYTKNTSFNRQPARTNMIMAASEDTFGFDCVNLVKGALWGWKGDKKANYGGAVYCSNGVPDIGETAMINRCADVSSDFSKIEVGELLYMPGHVGVYIGNGLAVECSSAFKNCVQITAVKNIGTINGQNHRRWTSHGKLPYFAYIKNAIPEKEKEKEKEPEKETVASSGSSLRHIVKKGDTLYAISKKYGVAIDKIVKDNKTKYPKMTANYIVVGWNLEIKK